MKLTQARSPLRVRGRPGLLLFALALGLTLCSGCRLLGAAASAPVKATEKVLGKEGEPPPPDPQLQQLEVMRLADTVLVGLGSAARRFSENLDEGEGELAAAQWQLYTSRRTVQLASRADPAIALLDLIVLLRTHSMTLERHLIPNVWGDAALPILEITRALEEDAWEVAYRIVGEERSVEVRKAIDDWEMSLVDMDIANLKPPSVIELLEDRSGKGSNWGTLLSIDPFQGLEPVAREAALARLYAERLLFYTQHVPNLITEAIEIETMKAKRQPEVKQLLGDIEDVSTAVANFGTLAEAFPETVRVEREAAITQLFDEFEAERDVAVRQVFDELDAQRTAIMRDIQTAQEPLQELIVASRETLEAAERTSAELTKTVEATDAFIGRFVPEESEASEPPASAAPTKPDGPPAKPFDINEYTAAAAQLGVTAEELTGLVTELENGMPEVEQLLDAVVERGQASIDHAFRRGLQLGLALIGAVLVAILVLRFVKRS